MRKKAPTSIAYANARLRVRRLKLFKKDTYESFLDASSVEDLTKRLRATPLEPHINAALLLETGADMLGLASTKFLAAELKFVTEMLTKIDRRCIEVIIEIQDLVDLKTVIRGKVSGAEPAQIIESFVGPGWSISREDLNLLASQETIQEVLEVAVTLKTPYARVIKKFAPRLKESMQLDSELDSEITLIEFELALDKKYYSWALSQLSLGRDRSKMVRSYIKQKIDVSNILIAFRAIQADFDEDEEGKVNEELKEIRRYFISGGSEVSRKLFLTLIEIKEIHETILLLKPTPYYHVLDEMLVGYGLEGTLVSFEKGLSDFLVRDMQVKGYRDFLGLGIPVAYVLAVLAQSTNIRIIARAKSYRVPANMIQKELIFV